MTTQELLAEIYRLSLEEQLELLEALSRDIRQTLHTSPPTSVPVERIRGLLTTETPLPSDEQLKQDYLDYLQAKYS